MWQDTLVSRVDALIGWAWPTLHVSIRVSLVTWVTSLVAGGRVWHSNSLVHLSDHSLTIGFVHGAGSLVEQPPVHVQSALEVAFGSNLGVGVEEGEILRSSQVPP
jgi:hypothetical protein